jgi:hypothetical protein
MALRAPRQVQTPPPKLLRQRVAQLAIIIDNENLARIRHQFRPPQPLARTVIFACRHQVDKRYRDKGRYFSVAAGRTRSGTT